MSLYDYGGRRFSVRNLGSLAANLVEEMGVPLPFNITQPQGSVIPQKFAESLSQTKTETEEDTVMTEDTAVGIKKSFMKVSSGNSTVKRTSKKPFEYRDQYWCMEDWASNNKKFVVVGTYGSKEQYLNSTNQFNMQRDSWHKFIDMQPMQLLTGSGAVTTEIKDDWMSIDYCMLNMDILNETNLPLEMKVMYFRSETDQEENVLTVYEEVIHKDDIFISDFVGPTLGTPAYPSASGAETLISVTPGDSNTYDAINTVPYTFLTSREKLLAKWKFLKSTTITLASGDIHRLTTKLDCNMFQSRSHLENMSSYPVGCVQCVVSFQGLASHVSGDFTGGESYNCPTLAPGKVSMVLSRCFVLRGMKNPSERFDPVYQGRGNVLYGAPVIKANTINFAEVAATAGQYI